MSDLGLWTLDLCRKKLDLGRKRLDLGWKKLDLGKGFQTPGRRWLAVAPGPARVSLIRLLSSQTVRIIYIYFAECLKVNNTQIGARISHF